MAGFSVQVRGSAQLKDLGVRLKAAGGERRMRLDMLSGIRKAAAVAIPDVRESARTTLPRRGGLAERVAEQSFGVRTSLVSGRVRIAGRGMKELRDIDSGKVRHPVFGNREVWRQQDVEPGFFSKPIEAKAPEIRAEIVAAMSRVAESLVRPL